MNIEDFAGFAYNPAQDIFYAERDSWQRKFGYCRAYDLAAPFLDMIIDSEPVYFAYAGKNWLIELWKGQYGMTTGAEIGVYCTSRRVTDKSAAFYSAADDEDMPILSLQLIKNGRELFHIKQRHWWLTGFRLGEYSELSELRAVCGITFPDKDMLGAFAAALAAKGYTRRNLYVSGLTARIKFGEPLSEQPFTRTPERMRESRELNAKLCELWGEAAYGIDGTLRKIEFIEKSDPDLYKKIMSVFNMRGIQRQKRKIPRNDRISQAFDNSPRINADNSSKIVIFSDCHRGAGGRDDDFADNENAYYTALSRYYDDGFTYVELGDGDELWKNRKFSLITDENSRIFALLSAFNSAKRFYTVYGNHDIVKRYGNWRKNNLPSYYDERERRDMPLFPQFADKDIPEGLIITHRESGKSLYLLHGHQGDLLNDKLWRLARFLVRNIWRPLELIGLKDPQTTEESGAKLDGIEERLSNWADKKGVFVIAGHTHRPAFAPPYFNCGSCVHPRYITALEIVNGEISLVKWGVETRDDGTLFIGKTTLNNISLK